MFCLGCGAELSARAEVCAVCGRPAHPESPLSPRASQRVMLTASSATRSPARSMERAANPYVSPSARVATPSVASGDLALFALPSDVTGRLVVALPLLLSADLLAPWILFGDAHIAPVRAGLLVLLAALPLALIAGMTVYLPFRQRPILAAIPLAIAALALGGGLTLLLVVGPFGARIVRRDTRPLERISGDGSADANTSSAHPVARSWAVRLYRWRWRASRRLLSATRRPHRESVHRGRTKRDDRRAASG
jgi:hypothetical protein